MKHTLLLLLMAATVGIEAREAKTADTEPTSKIDYAGFEALTQEAGRLRAERRISEDEFVRMASEKGTVVLDTRSREKFEKLHVKGAVHLNFSDFTEESLARVIPEKTTRILIYCNNNFEGAGAAMVMKSAPLALNIPTFINLYGYGYQNLYELKPYLDVRKTRIPFAGSDVLKKKGN